MRGADGFGRRKALVKLVFSVLVVALAFPHIDFVWCRADNGHSALEPALTGCCAVQNSVHGCWDGHKENSVTTTSPHPDAKQTSSCMASQALSCSDVLLTEDGNIGPDASSDDHTQTVESSPFARSTPKTCARLAALAHSPLLIRQTHDLIAATVLTI